MNDPIQSQKKLAELPLLKLGADVDQGRYDWRSYFKRRCCQVEPSEPVLSFNNYRLLIQVAIAGQGVGMGWGALLDDLLESDVLVGLRKFSLRTDGGYYVVEPKPRELLHSKQYFIDWLLAEQQVRAELLVLSCHKLNWKCVAIARAVEVHRSTDFRELRRNITKDSYDLLIRPITKR